MLTRLGHLRGFESAIAMAIAAVAVVRRSISREHHPYGGYSDRKPRGETGGSQRCPRCDQRPQRLGLCFGQRPEVVGVKLASPFHNDLCQGRSLLTSAVVVA